MNETERLAALGGRRSARRAATLLLRTTPEVAAQVEAAAKAARLTRQSWLEAQVLRALPRMLDDCEPENMPAA